MTPYYQDDQATIYHGDCHEIMPTLDFDVIVTDPPYGISWAQGANSVSGCKAHPGILNDEDTTARDEALALRRSAPALVFGSFYAPQPADIKQILVWQKGDTQGVVGSVTGYRRDVEPVYLVGDWPKRNVEWSSVVRSLRGSWNDELSATGHPHTKPLDLMRLLVERCPPGVVLDPFMGSGSTLRAAKELGRKAIGIEINEEYCQVAVNRLAQGVLFT
jgi:site-specific DNA-methyltransferase (adenine-specific)